MQLRIFSVALYLLHVITCCIGGNFSSCLERNIQSANSVKFWKERGAPVYMLVRFFNVTNTESVLLGHLPILEEVGPYVYEEHRRNQVDGLSADGSTVSYRSKTKYIFRAEFSKGSEQDVITTLNLPYIGMQKSVSELGGFVELLGKSILSGNKERLFVKKTVSELLFQGYYQKSLEQLGELSGKEILPNNTFGFFYGKNNTFQEPIEVYTGASDLILRGQVRSWGGNTSLGFWSGEECNKIEGSDGSFYSPGIRKTSRLRFFSPDMCRSLHLVYEKSVRIQGKTGYRFGVPLEVLGSPELTPDNQCFCDGERGNCLKTGGMRIGACRDNAPVVISWPHFFNADEEYLSKSVGLNPNATLHRSFVTLEPETGLIWRGSKRYQINVELKPNRFYRDLGAVQEMIFPILWIDETNLSRFGSNKYAQTKEECQSLATPDQVFRMYFN